MTIKMASFTCLQIILMIGMLITGSINTLSKKAQNDCTVEGYPEKSKNNTATVHEFDHPWFQTWIMFIVFKLGQSTSLQFVKEKFGLVVTDCIIFFFLPFVTSPGESICLVGLFIHRRREMKEWRKQVLESEAEAPDPPYHARVIQLIVVLPTVCDLVGTSLAGIGLVYVDASVWQMLRGSIIIFAGILSKIFLKRKLRPSHWLGMTIVMMGLILVGCSSVFKNQDHKSSTAGGKTLFGILLILGSQLVSASQMVIEEAFLKKRNFHPLHVVGLEGTYGFLLMSIIVLPAMYFIPGSDVNGSYENSLDALYQIYHSPRLLVFCLLYLTSIAFYNYFGLAVTRSLTAVHRTLIDACRTMLVWAADLLIYYAFDKEFGEPFDKTYGILQIDGFIFLMIGTAIYNQLVDLRDCVPCVSFKSEELSVVTSSDYHGNIQSNYRDEEDDTRRRLLEDER